MECSKRGMSAPPLAVCGCLRRSVSHGNINIYGSFSSGFGSVSRKHGPRILGIFFRDARFQDRTKSWFTLLRSIGLLVPCGHSRDLLCPMYIFFFFLDMQGEFEFSTEGGGRDWTGSEYSGHGKVWSQSRQLVLPPPAVVRP